MEQIQSSITLWGVVAILVYVILIIAFILIRLEGTRLKKFSNEAIGQNLLLGSSIIIGVLSAVSIFFIIELIQLNKNLNLTRSAFENTTSQSQTNLQSKIDQLTEQYTAADSSRSAVEAEYNDALARMDSLTGTNTILEGDLLQKKTSIDSLKNLIRVELTKQNGDLKKAHSMIGELNAKITDLLTQIDASKANQ